MSPYHHGELKTELIRLGLEHLERDGAEALSIRHLAEEAGVSKNAPYRHFTNKQDLLSELLNEGFRLLYLAMKKRRPAPEERPLAVMGEVYMAFAVSRPALYRLMTSTLVCRLRDDEFPWPRRAMGFLMAAVETEAPGGTQNSAAAAWAYIHGLTMLRIDQLLPHDFPEPDWTLLARNAGSLLYK